MRKVYAIKEIRKIERPQPGPNGAAAQYHLITELYFENPDDLKAVAETPEWKAVVADVGNFAAPGSSG